MRTPLLICVVTAVSTSCMAGETQRLELAALKLGPGVALSGEGDHAMLRIDRAQTKEKENVFLFHIESPVVTQESYAITGEVRYEHMEAGSFLELWNHFPVEKDGSEIGASYFSRTLGVSGPMGQLTGDSDWRPFQLPFFMNDGSGRRPLRLTFNAQFAGGGGVVEIRNLRFIDGAGAAGVMPLGAGLLVTGAVIGALVAAVVGLIIWRVSRARTRRELRRIQAADV